MADGGKEQMRGKRTYRAPQRQAAADRTRQAILAAAKRIFEEQGWSGATMRAIAADVGVSQKTVEAIYRTKGGLLEAVVAYAIRGDSAAVEMPARAAIAEMEAAPDARSMLDLHAAHLARVNPRSAGIAWVVEHAAAGGGQPAELWAQMNRNRSFGVRWATKTLLSKPQTEHLRPPDVKTAFWVAIDWATYRVLSQQAGLTARQYEAWLVGYYRQMFLFREPR
jgi:AcrR family transcriptional regulator